MALTAPCGKNRGAKIEYNLNNVITLSFESEGRQGTHDTKAAGYMITCVYKHAKTPPKHDGRHNARNKLTANLLFLCSHEKMFFRGLLIFTAVSRHREKQQQGRHTLQDPEAPQQSKYERFLQPRNEERQEERSMLMFSKGKVAS